MSILRQTFISLVSGILICSNMGAEAEERPTQTLFNVGYRVLDFKSQKGGSIKTLTVAVWYPTAREPKPHNYGGPTNGRIAMDALPLTEKGPYPMLVFSHGYGGSGLGSVFFTERLAARGWIVAAPDHHDRHSAVRIRTGQLEDFSRRGLWRGARELGASDPEDRRKYLYRLDEMRFVVDRMVSSEDFRGIIDNKRVAVGGHSFGGYTALGLSGTIQERHDPRIKAVLLFSTGAGGYLFRETELASVRIPSMLFMGEREKGQQRGRKTMSEITDKIYRNLSPPKYFLEVKGASHFSFNNRFVDKPMTRRLSGTEEEFVVIRKYSIAFLEKHVAGKKGSNHILQRRDKMLTRYTRQPGLDSS
ncbi:MAG: hypothetical protein V2J25_16855 [Desulfatiglans sp.]|jgi:predicted dienelactone hydrolase|nr:hypothetical protein [Desulfatiglans sp.]